MKEKEIQPYFLKMLALENLSDCKRMLDIYVQYLFNIIVFHKDKGNEKRIDVDAKILLQMIFSKAAHMVKLVEGISHAEGTLKLRIVDPTFIANSLRNLFETVLLFNLIYIHPKSEEERNLIYDLWNYSGLKYRQRFSGRATQKGNKEKMESEALQIQNIQDRILKSDIYKSLSLKDQNKIDQLLKKKEYKMIIEGNQIVFKSWQELVPVAGIREGMFDDMYTFFSLHAHPSYVSVFQFNGMFKGSTNEKLACTHIRNYVLLLSLFVSDYLKYFTSVRPTFEKLELWDQIVINGHHTLIRPDAEHINDALSHME